MANTKYSVFDNDNDSDEHEEAVVKEVAVNQATYVRRPTISDRARVIYLAGPLRGDVQANIDKARAVAVKLWKAGYAVVSPHLNSGTLSDVLDEERVLMLGSLAIMAKCDAVVVMDGWESSLGTMRELRVAIRKRIEILIWDEAGGMGIVRNLGWEETARMRSTLWPGAGTPPPSPCAICTHSFHAGRETDCSGSCPQYRQWIDEQTAGVI